jgi:hypothetical protein
MYRRLDTFVPQYDAPISGTRAFQVHIFKCELIDSFPKSLIPLTTPVLAQQVLYLDRSA